MVGTIMFWSANGVCGCCCVVIWEDISVDDVVFCAAVLNMSLNVFNADRWLVVISPVSNCEGFLIASIKSFAAISILSVGVAIGILPAVGINCAVAHILFLPVLGIKNW